MMFKELLSDTERLRYRTLVDSDAEGLFQIYSDNKAMRHRSSKPMSSIADAHSMIASQIKPESIRFGIEEKSENILIGTLLIKHDFDDPKQCEIGFSFDKNYWNQGYGQETTKMLIAGLKKFNHFNKLIAWSKKENPGSMKIFEKLGFTKSDQDDYPDSCLFVLDVAVNFPH